jgi:hypothetical protein
LSLNVTTSPTVLPNSSLPIGVSDEIQYAESPSILNSPAEIAKK